MPDIPEQQFEDDTPRFKDLKKGTVLKIVNVAYDKTKKNGYDCVTVTLVDGSEIFGTDAGVLRALKTATEKFGEKFSESDPLIATVDSYTDKFNNERVSLS